MRATATAMRIARQSRRQLSLPEQLLWRLLKQFRGELRFRRQHPVGPYVADFYCPAAKLVIEVDGRAHEWRTVRDSRRDDYVASLGLRTLRLSATEVLSDPVRVAEGLLRLCQAPIGPSTTQLR